MTAKTRTLILCLALLLATPLSGEVFAQSEEAATTTPEAAEATTTEAAPAEPEEWFTIERIFGKKDNGDFVVGPGKTEVELAPGESATHEIWITNRIDDNRTFRLEVEDIVGTPDGSRVLNLVGKSNGPYSISSYISFPDDTFTLDQGERARIPVTVTVPPNIEAGGYYGTILVSIVEEGGVTDDNAIRPPVVYRAGSHVFLTIKGDKEIGGKTTGLSLIEDKWWYESGPIQLGILYENTGSVHLNPSGSLEVTNMFGQQVGFVELEPWFVLPRSLRIREITWDREFLLGRYTVKAEIDRGYDGIVDEVKVSFWVLPWKIVGGTFLGLFIILFSVRAFFRTFEFKRKGP